MSVKSKCQNKEKSESFEAQKIKDAVDWAEEKIIYLNDREVQNFVKGFEEVGFRNFGIRKILRDFNDSLPDEQRIDKTPLNKSKGLYLNKILSRFITDNRKAFHDFLEQNYQNYGMTEYKKGYLDNIITNLCDNVIKISNYNKLFKISYDDLYFEDENISSDDEINEVLGDEYEFRSHLSDLLDSILDRSYSNHS